MVMRLPGSGAASSSVLGAAPRCLTRGVSKTGRCWFWSRLAQLERGCVVIEDSDDVARFGQETSDFPVAVRVRVHASAFYLRVLLLGSEGAGESYVRGEWDCDDLPCLARIIAANRGLQSGMDLGLARLSGLGRRLHHWRRRNTRAGSRRNIEAHYDVGNEFFSLVLDPTMTYSSAYFEDACMSLESAQVAKYERICRKLDLGPGDEVLEIGTGWGGFALHAATRHGCRVTTTTISKQQYALATARVREAGLGSRVEVLLEDYRNLRGRFGKLVSIEMIEAVGADHLDEYFRVCGERLESDGLMLIQAILTPDYRYAESLRSVDFTKKHIFPGGQLPSLAAIFEALGRATDLRLLDFEEMGDHYARTVRCWSERLRENRHAIHALPTSQWFVRAFEYYLGLCEGGFQEGAIGVAQLRFAKPASRARPLACALPEAAP